MTHKGKVVFVRYGFHVADLLGTWDRPGRYDIEECVRKYTALCWKALKREYPVADIEVASDVGASGALSSSMNTEVLRLAARGEEPAERTDPFEIDRVESICDSIHEGYEWEVPRKWLAAREAHERFGVPIPTICWACDEDLIDEAELVEGRWEFPQDAFRELMEDTTLASCRDILGIHLASEGRRAFQCYPATTLGTSALEILSIVDDLLILASGLGIPSLDDADSYLLIARRDTRVQLVYKHFVAGTRPPLPWTYDSYGKGMVSQARHYPQIDAGLYESERGEDRIAEGMWFTFDVETLVGTALADLVDGAADTLRLIDQDARLKLSGGPDWVPAYEEDEALFCEEVLHPLLRKMGFLSVRYTHGTRECGKDFVFSEQTQFGDMRHHGLQAKAGNVRGGVNSEIDEILGQVEDAFAMPFYDVSTQEDKFISTLVIAISGRFTASAEAKVKRKMRSILRGSVYFWDKEKIIGLVHDHWREG